MAFYGVPKVFLLLSLVVATGTTFAICYDNCSVTYSDLISTIASTSWDSTTANKMLENKFLNESLEYYPFAQCISNQFTPSERPNVSCYFPSTVEAFHLEDYETDYNGASRVMNSYALAQSNYSTIGDSSSGQWVGTYSGNSWLFQNCADNNESKEAQCILNGLTIVDGDSDADMFDYSYDSYGLNRVIRIYVRPQNVSFLNPRMASGSETGANAGWMPGGYTTGGQSEAIIDQIADQPDIWCWEPVTDADGNYCWPRCEILCGNNNNVSVACLATNCREKLEIKCTNSCATDPTQDQNWTQTTADIYLKGYSNSTTGQCITNTWYASRDSRMNVSCYITDELQDYHLMDFKEYGSSFIGNSKYASKEDFIKIGRDDGQWVMPYNVQTNMLDTCLTSDDIKSCILDKLGIDDAYSPFYENKYGMNAVILVYIPAQCMEKLELRVTSGKQDGTNSNWRPGAYTSGGKPEATLNQLKMGEFCWKAVSNVDGTICWPDCVRVCASVLNCEETHCDSVDIDELCVTTTNTTEIPESALVCYPTTYVFVGLALHYLYIIFN